MSPTAPPDDRPTADRVRDDQREPSAGRSLAATTEVPQLADVPATEVPDGATPARCPYCDRPFPRERLLDLHLGERHAAQLTSAERAAFEAAEERETDDLFVYHLKVVAAIVLVVMGLSYVYVFALV